MSPKTNCCVRGRFLHCLPMLIGIVLMLALMGRADAQDTMRLLKAGDKAYAEKSYGIALKRYEEIAKRGDLPAHRRDEIALRTVLALGRVKQWDSALSKGIAFVKSHRQTVWEPRGLHALAQIYLNATHEGYQVGSRFYRSDDVAQSKSSDNDSAEYRDKENEDVQHAREALEAARVLYDKNAVQFRSRFSTHDEEIQLNYDLVRTLTQDTALFNSWAEKKAWLPLSEADWEVNPAAPYDLNMPPPQKARFLFAQIRRLAASEKDADELVAKSLIGVALWLKHYHGEMTSWARKWNGQEWVNLPYPYEKIQPSDVLGQLVKQYPNSAVREQAQYLHGVSLEEEGKFSAAVGTYRALIAARPRSKWVSDSRLHIAQIQRSELTVEHQEENNGKPIRLHLASRNVKQVRLTAYRVRLEDIVTQRTVNPEEYSTEENVRAMFGKAWSRRKSGGKVAEWTVAAGDRGDYRGRRFISAFPVRENGAYLVEASAAGITSSALVVVSDLALVQKVSGNRGLFYVTDKATGKPVAGVQILVQQIQSEDKRARWHRVRGVTNAEGMVTLPLSVDPNGDNLTLYTLAFKGSHYAFTSPTVTYSYDRENASPLKIYSLTDRSVYRPTQTVNYRHILLQRKGDSFLPAARKPVRITVTDPNGKPIHKRSTTANEFGSASGECKLPQNARLGEYTISVTRSGTSPQVEGRTTFRVEEYKKPEFEVTVSPEAERVRLGQPVSAKIGARYYFGGAVTNAKVTYRIYRSDYSQTYQFPKPYDFLYNAEDEYRRSMMEYSRKVITQGVARTDANGEAKIEFPTTIEADPQDYESRYGRPEPPTDQTFTIEADVQDASRRVISGSGSVRATQHDVAVFLDFPHGFANTDETLEVKIRTLNPSNLPVSASGLAKVVLMPDKPKGKETLVYQEQITTDAQGDGLLKWTATRAGQYRIVFVAQDGVGKTVKSEVMVWVDGAELRQGQYQADAAVLAVKQTYVQEGDKAKILLITPEPDCYVLLTREADSDIRDKRIVRVMGCSVQFEVPVSRRDAPNVHLSAVLIRKGEAYHATAEILVPPVRQFTTVTVQTDKPRYEPGEKATFRLAARDWQGRPVRTELSVSVSDAALQYIQRNDASDIRTFVYGDRRSQNVEEGNSTDAELTAHTTFPPDKRQFRVHRWTLPEGMGQLSEWAKSEEDYSPRRDPFSVAWQVPGRTIRAGESVSIRARISDYEGGQGRYVQFSLGGRSDGYYSSNGKDIAGMGGMMGGKAVANAAKPRIVGAGVVVEKEAYALTPAPGDEGVTRQTTLIARRNLMQPAIRSRFADTAFWTPAKVTDADGNATVEVTMPDNLTQWKANVVGNTVTAQVGSGETQVVTKKDLLVRLQSPRFLVEQDKVVLSANVLNSLPEDARVKVQIQIAGSDAEILTEGQPAENAVNTKPNTSRELWVDIPKESEKRVDWTVQVKADGDLWVLMATQSEKAADATQTTLPVLVHGVEKLTSQSGVLRGTQSAQLTVALPQARKAKTSELIVQINPSLAAVMLDALPYLADYPYGCIEQTLSRFVPCVVLSKSLKDLGYNLDDLKQRAKRQAQAAKTGSSVQRVLNSPYTSPNGLPGDILLPDASTLSERARNPVFDRTVLQKMISDGLARIAANQNADGGWGWWKDSDSDPTMSSYVCYGLLLARESGTKVDARRLARGLDYLETVLPDKGDLHEQAFAARVLAMEPRYRLAVKKVAKGELFRKRDQLTAYAKALLALALHACGDKESGRLLLRNLEAVAQIDRANGTAHWNGGGKSSWRWYNNSIETNAAILQAYLTIQPNSEMPALLVKWLVNNRRSSIWNSTRETALAVYALADYIRVKKELAGNHTVTVNLDNRVQRTYQITRENALLFDNRLFVPDAQLTAEHLPLTITQTGTGNCYYTAYTRTFSQEENLKATSNEIAVTRRYFRLLPLTAQSAPKPQPLDPLRPNPFLTGEYNKLTAFDAPTNTSDSGTETRYQRVAIKNGEELASGELIEVELAMESNNDYDYLIFEDIKPAGCEPVEVRSGGQDGKGVYANREMRDQKVVFFLDELPQGRRTLSYRVRAEMPGQFRSLPVSAYAMYAPAIRAISDEQKMTVHDSEP